MVPAQPITGCDRSETFPVVFGHASRPLRASFDHDDGSHALEHAPALPALPRGEKLLRTPLFSLVLIVLVGAYAARAQRRPQTDAADRARDEGVAVPKGPAPRIARSAEGRSQARRPGVDRFGRRPARKFTPIRCSGRWPCAR